MQKRSQTTTRSRGTRASTRKTTSARSGRKTTSARARTTTRSRASSRMTESRRRATVPRSRRTAARRPSGKTALSAQTTIDHDVIRQWAEERDGTPATVVRTTRPGQESSILRIDFPGFSGEGTLRPIDWEEWFRQFEDRNLAFLHQDRAANGELSRFFKLIRRPD